MNIFSYCYSYLHENICNESLFWLNFVGQSVNISLCVIDVLVLLHNLLMNICIIDYAYCTVKKNFGGDKTLVNLVNHNNLPTFFTNFPVFVT